MLDKNHNQNSGIVKAKKFFEQNTFTNILCQEPFVKAKFLTDFIDVTELPIIYIDFDLLYSGYLVAEIVPTKKNVTVFRPSEKNLKEVLKDACLAISNKKCFVILDSLNGFYMLFDEEDVGRFVKAYVMLLAFLAQQSKSNVLVVNVAKLNEENKWVVLPTGRQIVKANGIPKIFLKKQESAITMEILGSDNSIMESIKIS